MERTGPKPRAKHARSFVKASIAGRLNRGEVYEYVFAVLARNKSKAF